MKKLKKVLLVFLIIALIITAGALSFSLYYEKEVRKILISQINKNLTTQVFLDDIDLNLLRRFPKVSLIIKDVKLRESFEGSTENLAEIKRIYLVMNLKGFIRKNYTIERLEIIRGDIHIKINEQNQNNFQVWKSSESEEKPIDLELNKIYFDDLHIQYSDLYNNIALSTMVQDIKVSGDLHSDIFNLKMKGESQIDSLVISENKYLTNNDFYFENEITVDQPNATYTIKNSRFELEELLLTLSGNIKETSQGYMTDLIYQSQDFELDDITAFLPDTLQDAIETYKIHGNIEIKGSVKGQYHEKQIPQISTDFNLMEGSISKDKSRLSLEKLSINGNFLSGTKADFSAASVLVEKFYAEVDDRKIEGLLKVNGLNDPEIETRFTSNLNLKDYLEIYPVEKVDDADGKMFITADFKGKLKELQNLSFSKSTQLNLKLLVQEAYLTQKNKAAYHDVEGNIMIDNNILTINNIEGHFSKSHFKLKGKAVNFLNYLSKEDENLFIKADLYSDLLQVDELYHHDDTETDTATYLFSLPPRVKFGLNIQCKKAVYDKFIAENIKGRITLSKQGMVLDDLHLYAAQGRMTLNGRLFDESSDQFSIDGMADLENIDIAELFYQLDNLGQDYITDKNLEGRMNAKIRMNSFWYKDLSPNMDKLFATADVSLKDGELNDFKPLINLLGFIKMKKMRDIEFEEINNTLLIKDKQVIIPNMDINSSAFSMSVAGTHNFDNTVDYKFKINMTELLFGSKKADRKNYENYGESDGSGGINLFVTMTGPADDPKFKYDRKAAGEKVKEGLKKEKKELFDLFRKKEENAEEEFEIEWDDK